MSVTTFEPSKLQVLRSRNRKVLKTYKDTKSTKIKQKQFKSIEDTLWEFILQIVEKLNIPETNKIFYHVGRYIFRGQMVLVGNYRGMVSSRDKIFYVGSSTHTWGYGKFVIARYACFTNSNAKLRLCLRLHLDFLPSLRSGKKPAIRPCAFIRPYIN